MLCMLKDRPEVFNIVGTASEGSYKSLLSFHASDAGCPAQYTQELGGPHKKPQPRLLVLGFRGGGGGVGELTPWGLALAVDWALSRESSQFSFTQVLIKKGCPS